MYIGCVRWLNQCFNVANITGFIIPLQPAAGCGYRGTARRYKAFANIHTLPLISKYYN